MRMSPEEKRELDEWVEKEYPKSMSRLNSSDHTTEWEKE